MVRARFAETLRLLAGREDDPRRLSPGESHLLGPGHQLLETTNGALDCLGSIGDGKTYEDLLDSTIEVTFSGGLKIRVLELSKLIEMKRQAGRPKDLAVIPHLEAALDELRKRRGA